MSDVPSHAEDDSTSAYGPLRNPLFRALWIAGLVSNIGTWIQDVGAGWLMTSLSDSPLMVAMIQSAKSLPMFLLALPAGALADIVDRRRVLLIAQLWMMTCAAALGMLTYLGMINEWVLIGGTLALGIGFAFNMPAWQAFVPELVPSQQLPAAVTLNSISINMSRSIGPAVAGTIVALAGPAASFLLNACSFLAVVAVLWRWHQPTPTHSLPTQRLVAAMRAGIRHVATSPVIRSVLVRAGTFVFCASAAWAFLPLIARVELGRGPSAYGALLACLGMGAVSAGLLLPWGRRRFASDRLASGASLVLVFGLVGLALIRNFVALWFVMYLVGMTWTCNLATFNVSVQMTAPKWVRGRALSIYTLVVFAGMALGSAVWGAIAARFGISQTILIAAGGLASSLLLVPWFRLP